MCSTIAIRWCSPTLIHGPCGPGAPFAPPAPVAPVEPAAPAGPLAPVAPAAPVAPPAPAGPTAPAMQPTPAAQRAPAARLRRQHRPDLAGPPRPGAPAHRAGRIRLPRRPPPAGRPVPARPAGPVACPKSCSNVSRIEPGLSLHDLSALMSPTVSHDPRLSRQTTYAAFPEAATRPFAPGGPAAPAKPAHTKPAARQNNATPRILPRRRASATTNGTGRSILKRSPLFPSADRRPAGKGARHWCSIWRSRRRS